MATTPQIALRDGSGYTARLAFTTNQEAVFITGLVGADTVAVQISVNGTGFVADPNLASHVGQTLDVPNSSVYPSGLPLEFGVNSILIRAVDIVGGVSATASIIITRVVNADTTGTQIPTGIRVQRHRDQVKLQAAKPQPIKNVIVGDSGESVVVTTQTKTFLGFNFYASAEPAGASGYYRVNDKPVLVSAEYEQDDIIAYSDLALWDVSNNARTLRVRVSEEDDFGNELAVRLDAYHDNTTISGKLRFSSTLQNYEMNEFVSFFHNRQGGNGVINTDQFISVPSTDPLYYVVTAVYYDPNTSTEIETPFSQEVLGAPLIIDTTIRDLPGRTQTQIVIDYMNAVLRVNSEIALIPGSVTRDVDIDPFASEAERIWFLLDFVHRSQSFLTLLAIDNVSNNGTSDAVASSAYKQALKAALGLLSDSAVQSLIDQQFDKLAANVNKTRLAGRQATGTLTLYTSTRPTKDVPVPAGAFAISSADANTGVVAQRYRIGGSFVLTALNADAFYNFNERRYEIRVPIVAENVGSAGNVPAKTIKTVLGVSGLKAINETAIVFGSDIESNADLAARAMLGFAAVDTGTEVGYSATAAAKVGVIRNKVIKSGDPLMMRDYDEVRRKHIGGKVDVWVQGVQERQVQDRFAFTFDVALNIQCEVLDASSLRLRVLDSRVTPTTPIVEILNGVRNVSLAEDYDMTGVVIEDYRTFRLSTSVPQPATMADDRIIADYRFQAQNKLIMTVQPVRRIVSMVGEISGALTPDLHYKLYKTDDPLLEGESTIAKNYVAITPADGKPSGNSIVVNDELHVMIGFEQEPLASIGINTTTIRVFNEQRTLEYERPGASAPDFDIIPGTSTTPARIVRTAASSIVSGQEVSIDYVHDENFVVTYVINDLLQQLQQILNRKRHVTADVLAKQAIQNAIDIETTVQLGRGATKDKADPLLRNEVSLDLNKKLIGQGVAQSNVDAAINDTEGVQFNVLPMAKMAYADGSLKLRETMLSTYERVESLDLGGNIAYILTNPLGFSTTDGGGVSTEHKGVFQDDLAMSEASSLALVCNQPNQGFIIGSRGAIIAGYSDDATLAEDGFLPIQYVQERLRRTANHVVVSLLGSGVPVDSPSSHFYSASYVIRGDSGSHDINVSAVELIDLGVLTVTYRAGEAANG
jgi:hypothetical protein